MTIETNTENLRPLPPPLSPLPLVIRHGVKKLLYDINDLARGIRAHEPGPGSNLRVQGPGAVGLGSNFMGLGPGSGIKTHLVKCDNLRQVGCGNVTIFVSMNWSRTQGFTNESLCETRQIIP